MGSDIDRPQSAFDHARFRQVLGHVPTGVVVVTAGGDPAPVGIAIGSFTSVSLDPPLVGFFVGRQSTSWKGIEAAGRFRVNVLGEDQEEISRVFATSGTDRFGAVGWRPGRSGNPLLTGVLAWIECDIDKVVEAGDHLLVLGRVVDLDVPGTGGPLVFFRGGYGRFAV